MGEQVNNGKAFEWATGVALSSQGFELVWDEQTRHNQNCFEIRTEEKN